ncbi:hypothetical protein GCM10025865_26960 [Paraoerskovia sediminicola]|uniref:DUF3000 domain-containing protein n=1 Tax=Paraoerskovia sediminicola TaxID=1138587 RepID=A0ABM8G5D5_9CELL|nr:DUF3000 domain-containing protein [Paraoerskovia sediminicola]BDZ43397.1 hypothetical protein GCM10025865_26960 [Paraoerskovia sediminicola]
MNTAGHHEPPTEFRRALDSITGTRVRPDVALREVPAPTRIAPYAVALEASVDQVVPGSSEPATDATTGRFIVLHDPDGQPAWDGTFRVVTLVRTSLDPELAVDPLLGAVAWTWVEDALASASSPAHALGGTVSRDTSESFGALEGRDGVADLEIRASWTPDTPDLSLHLEAWATLLCTAAGLAPLPEGVSALRPRRGPTR